MHSTNKTAKPGNLPPLQATRLLDQLRERIRYRRYSIRTEQAYVYWVRYFVRWHEIRHPAEMAGPEVESFLSYLAVDRAVSSSTHRQALSALLFLYKGVLQVEIRVGHQNSTGTSGTFGRKHNDGLYPRAEPWRARREKST